MNNDFLTMLKVYSSGLWGTATGEIVIVSKKVCDYAIEQNIFPLFYSGIEILKMGEKIEISDDLYSVMRQIALRSVVRNEQKIDFMHSIFEEFEKNNIHYCVLKGEALSKLYNDSACRISGDTDILINKCDVEIVSQMLKKKGFEIEPIFPTSNHLVARHTVGGVLECHFELYDKHISEPLFKDYGSISEEYAEIDSDRGRIKTLGINDGLFFVFFHYVKHFLSEGVGIRQLTDVLMYIRQHKEKIEWDTFFDMIKDLHFDKLFDVTLTIGIEYLCFSKNDFPEFSEGKNLTKMLLEDIQRGGVFGTKDANRKNFSYIVLEKKQNKTIIKIQKWYLHRLLYIFFPQKQLLEKRYSYLQKSVILYPVAWMNRVIDVLFIKKGRATLKHVFNPAAGGIKIDINRERLELMTKLNIFGK